MEYRGIGEPVLTKASAIKLLINIKLRKSYIFAENVLIWYKIG